MGASNIFSCHDIHIDSADGTDDWIDQIQSCDVEVGITNHEESGSSEVDRLMTAVQGRESMLNILTTQLGFLATCGLDGVRIYPDATNVGCNFWGKFHPIGGTRDEIATTTHMKGTISDGLAVPVSISGSHQQIATMQFAIHAILGTAAQSKAQPILFEKDQAITSGGGGDQVRYVPAVIKYTTGAGNVYVADLQSVNIDFGISVMKKGGGSEVDHTFVGIRSRNPSFNFSILDLELFADITSEHFVECTSFAIYFQKVDANADRVAIGTAEHLSIISTSGMLKLGSASLPHNETGQGSLNFTPVQNTNLFTISTTATIPAS